MDVMPPRGDKFDNSPTIWHEIFPPADALGGGALLTRFQVRNGLPQLQMFRLACGGGSESDCCCPQCIQPLRNFLDVATHHGMSERARALEKKPIAL